MSAVYMDHAATTPVRREVREAMEPYLSEVFGNPSSLHRWGRAASAALEGARAEIADALGARASEIRFVRGGTESDNLAILGACRACVQSGPPPRLIVSAIEHSAVLEAAQHAEAGGLAEVDVFEVTPRGEVDLTALGGARNRGREIVSAMWVNNETGLQLPVTEIADHVVSRGGILHSDASQAVGKVPVRVDAVPVHLLTATGHKINGPRGMGILFIREGTPISPLHHGGGQERGLRPGTEDVAGAVGLATAIRLAVEEQASFSARATRLRDTLESSLSKAIDGLRVNCGGGPRAPHVSSVGIPGIGDASTLLMALDLEGIAVSGGSACHSGAAAGSHVIAALFGEDDDRATLRFSYGRTTTDDDVARAVEVTVAVVSRLRSAA